MREIMGETEGEKKYCYICRRRIRGTSVKDENREVHRSCEAHVRKMRLLSALNSIVDSEGFESELVENFIISNSHVPNFEKDARDMLQLRRGLTNKEPELISDDDEDPYGLNLDAWKG